MNCFLGLVNYEMKNQVLIYCGRSWGWLMCFPYISAHSNLSQKLLKVANILLSHLIHL